MRSKDAHKQLARTSLKRPKRLFKFGAEASITWDCTHKEKINFEGFNQNGCYGNHPHLSVVSFCSLYANSCRIIRKQDFNFKRTYLLNLCSALCNKPKFLQ